MNLDREPTVSVHLCITMDGKPVDVRFERPSEWDGDTLVFTNKVPLLFGGRPRGAWVLKPLVGADTAGEVGSLARHEGARAHRVIFGLLVRQD